MTIKNILGQFLDDIDSPYTREQKAEQRKFLNDAYEVAKGEYWKYVMRGESYPSDYDYSPSSYSYYTVEPENPISTEEYNVVFDVMGNGKNGVQLIQGTRKDAIRSLASNTGIFVKVDLGLFEFTINDDSKFIWNQFHPNFKRYIEDYATKLMKLPGWKKYAGWPKVRVNSGYRSLSREKTKGIVKSSATAGTSHSAGMAIDLTAPDNNKGLRELIAISAYAYGFGLISYGKNHIHIDAVKRITYAEPRPGGGKYPLFDPAHGKWRS
jgi:hypothetical protein